MTKHLFQKGNKFGNKFKKGVEHPRKVPVTVDKEGQRISRKKYLINLRKSVLEALGNKCIRCEYSDARALQIDHVNGGGSRERKTMKGTFEKLVLQSFLNKENKYQLLCANCNWIKRVENNERNK